jgi:uncharacterized membrane protein YhaH (DUF805 family)
MEWYFMIWRKYAEFDGRSRRKEYWMGSLFNVLALLVLASLGLAGLAISEDYGPLLFIPLGLYYLAMIIPFLAVSVRRLHDTGKSGWLLLLFFVLGVIPIVGLISTIIQIVIMCEDSAPGPNEYGPNPKFPEQAVGMFAGSGGFTSLGLGGESNFGFCRSCGAKFKDAAPFCSGCGVQR